jgi:hypothetical protein
MYEGPQQQNYEWADGIYVGKVDSAVSRGGNRRGTMRGGVVMGFQGRRCFVVATNEALYG